MTNLVETNQTKKRLPFRKILLMLAVISSPLTICGCLSLLSALPFPMNIFQTEARVENRSAETLYITPITTTHGQPEVIIQLAFAQQRIPLQPKATIVLTYDSADTPLSGIGVCRPDDDCRLLPVDHSNTYYVDTFEQLSNLEPGWLFLIQSLPLNNRIFTAPPALGLLPIALFLIWLYLGRLENKTKP